MNTRPASLALVLAIALQLPTVRATAAEPTPQLSPAQLAILQYAYVDFPRQLQAANNDAALAAARVAFQQQRVADYRPFRSFHQYGAWYGADQRAQLQLLAAQQELYYVNQCQLDVWRQRQAAVAAMLLQSQ